MKAKAAKANPSASKTTAFGYDAVENKGRRRAPATGVQAEHVVLPDSKRKKLLGTVQDQLRNASTMAWMVRRHLDYVSRFHLSFNTGNEKLDRLVQRIFDWHAQPQNFDVAQRLGREEMFRLFEAEKVTAGDAGMLKLSTGNLQAIESDLLAYPRSGPRRSGKRGEYDPLPAELLAEVDKDTGAVLSLDHPGRVEKWCICNRGWDGKVLALDHLEPASNVIFDAYLTRFSSQIRGVSPLSTAINAIQDLYEGMEWNLLKAKVHAIFGVAIMRDYAGASTDQQEVSQLGSASGITQGTDEGLLTATESEAGTKSISSSIQQLKPDSMLMVDMETKGRIDTIESRTPSAEFREYSELVLRIAMLALDIPFTAYNSHSSSFSGMIADQNFYETSCKWKREKNKWARKNYSDWLLSIAWDSADWRLRQVAEEAGITRLRDLQEFVEWIPSGTPWLQKLQEVQGDIKSIASGIDNPIDVCKRRGTDFFDNVDKTARAYAYAKAKGVPLMIGESGQSTVEEAEQAIEQDEAPAGDSNNE